MLSEPPGRKHLCPELGDPVAHLLVADSGIDPSSGRTAELDRGSADATGATVNQ